MTLVQGGLSAALVLVMAWFHNNLEAKKKKRLLEKKRQAARYAPSQSKKNK